MVWPVLMALGKGIAAGVVGTAAMTFVQTLEMKRTGRAPSTMPADAVARVLPVQYRSQAQKERVSNMVHWMYGAAWGGVYGLLCEVGVRRPATTLSHLGLVWGTELMALPRLGLMASPTTWSKREVAKDFSFHAVYATTTSIAYHAMSRWMQDREARASASLNGRGRFNGASRAFARRRSRAW